MNGDTMSENTLNAFLGEAPIGQFRRTNDGSIIFQYHDSYRWSQSPTPISLSMPITAAEYSGDIPRNFLEALVPESPQARDEAMRLHHARSTSAFDLLQAIGFDATGALRLSADPHLPIDDDSLIPISDSQIANRLRAAAPHRHPVRKRRRALVGRGTAGQDRTEEPQWIMVLHHWNRADDSYHQARHTDPSTPSIQRTHHPCALWRRWEYPWPTPLFTSLMGSQPSSASGMTV